MLFLSDDYMNSIKNTQEKKIPNPPVYHLKVTVRCMLWHAKNIQEQHQLLSPLHVLSRMGTKIGIMQVYFDKCQEDRTPNKC